MEIASALAYLHSLNILHGDLSGGNILLTSSNKDLRKFTCKVSITTLPAYPIRAAHQLILPQIWTCKQARLVWLVSI